MSIEKTMTTDLENIKDTDTSLNISETSSIDKVSTSGNSVEPPTPPMPIPAVYVEINEHVVSITLAGEIHTMPKIITESQEVKGLYYEGEKVSYLVEVDPGYTANPKSGSVVATAGAQIPVISPMAIKDDESLTIKIPIIFTYAPGKLKGTGQFAFPWGVPTELNYVEHIKWNNWDINLSLDETYNNVILANVEYSGITTPPTVPLTVRVTFDGSTNNLETSYREDRIVYNWLDEKGRKNTSTLIIPQNADGTFGIADTTPIFKYDFILHWNEPGLSTFSVYSSIKLFTSQFDSNPNITMTLTKYTELISYLKILYPSGKLWLPIYSYFSSTDVHDLDLRYDLLKCINLQQSITDTNGPELVFYKAYNSADATAKKVKTIKVTNTGKFATSGISSQITQTFIC